MDLAFDEIESDSPYIETIWQSQSRQAEPFISMADARSGLVITRYRGKTSITLRGPETRATPAIGHEGAELLGIRFKPGAFIPQFQPGLLIDRHDIELPPAGDRSFWLGGSAWEYPDPQNIETFILRLIRQGLLLQEPVVSQALQGHPLDLSMRTVQRRFLRATGMTNTGIFQIDRARQAVALLRNGASIPETVQRAGYFDQPHLTRAFRRFVGLTPAALARPDRSESLSFLYKTTSFEGATLWIQAEQRLPLRDAARTRHTL